MPKSLQQLNFELKAENPVTFELDYSHFGVVGSGDMEVLIEPAQLDGSVRIKVLTPVSGFDEIWRRVLERFVNETGLANARIEINDNNATPVVVSLRLRQALSDVC
jgi:malonate decarboxylase acyl carrier protein